MAESTIPDPSDEIHRALHARAIQRNNNIEAEATAIITEAVQPVGASSSVRCRPSSGATTH
ncbi:hypothetical protein AB0B25_26850 [Nocardia sp. NPDC049190]|uniref:FitA-like ribbon-helix-helix domain-containing protein n=1 Tax=Nocardia sp. NPDC049190 TaxID=3155650 RepID=UPI0033F5342B